jgi:hypothetical protein
MHKAAAFQSIGVINWLCQHQANLMNQLDSSFKAPLWYAISNDKFLSCKVLLFNGADVNKGCCEKYGSFLNLAIVKGQQYLV